MGSSDKVRVFVTLHGELRARFPDFAHGQSVTVAAGATVSDVLARIDATRHAWLVALNDVVASGDHPVREGDRLDLFPALEGG
jgi:sulfur carrier protein ThiS